MSTPNPAYSHPHLIPTSLDTPLPGRDATPADLQIPLREAVLAGDRSRIDSVGSRLLALGSRAVATDHTRLILAVAAARTATTVTAPPDLPGYWRKLGPSITMLQLETELHRKPGALAQSFENAIAFVDDACSDAVARLASGTKNMSLQIARLSAVRDLPSASHLAWHDVDLTSDAPELYGEAKLNAEYRHNHSRIVAYERGKRDLARNPRWCAVINSFAATCRELGRRDEAVSWVARSMAITPNDYAARTMRKIGQDFDNCALVDLGCQVLKLWRSRMPHTERQLIAIKALTEAGLRAEVEAALDLPTRANASKSFALRAAADSNLLGMAA